MDDQAGLRGACPSWVAGLVCARGRARRGLVGLINNKINLQEGGLIMKDGKKQVLQYIDEKAQVFTDASDQIWDFEE